MLRFSMYPIASIACALASASAVHAQEKATLEPGLAVRLFEFDGDFPGVPELAGVQSASDVIGIDQIDLKDRYGKFTERVLVLIDGHLRVAKDGEYELRLICDDGGILDLDGRETINHDGAHGATPRDAKVKLSAGDHAFAIRHYQGAGGCALRLEWKPPGAADFTLVPREALLSAPAKYKAEPGKKKMIPPLRRGRAGDGAPVGGAHPGFRSAGDFPAGEMTFENLSSRVRVGTSGNHEPANFAVWAPGVGDAPLHAVTVRGEKSPYRDQLIVVAAPGDESRRLFVDSFPAQAKDFKTFDQTCAFRFGTSDGRSVEPTDKVAFEMLAVRAMTNGFEIEFTKPLDARCGWESDGWTIEQWPYDARTALAPKRDGSTTPVKSASVSDDRKKVFLEIPSLKTSNIVYLRMLPPYTSQDGESIRATEAWYTLNEIPRDRVGQPRQRPAQPPQNQLTDAEKADGWRLLFDGKSTTGWHPFKKKSGDALAGWSVIDGCIVRTGPGGDIASDDEFQNFELKLEWRISAAGNSGIFYGVSEADPNRWPWETGPEMQVLDNAEHADGRSPLTSAGSNYALYPPAKDATRPVGFFNEARIVIKGDHVEHWLNGEKLVEYEWGGADWQAKVKGSKFASMPRYGSVRKGHIALQDHGDRVWYRNIKIREIK